MRKYLINTFPYSASLIHQPITPHSKEEVKKSIPERKEIIPISVKEKLDFYEILRNAYPLAFLGSLLIIMATFTYNMKELPQVYPTAISGAFSFIFAFVASITSQLLRNRDFIKVEYFLKIATYFFLGVGILYLIFIAILFSGKIPQISQTVSAWYYGFFGIGASFWVYYDLRRIKNKVSISFIDKVTLPIGFIIAIFALTAMTTKLSYAILGIEIDDKFVTLILLGGLSVLGVIRMGDMFIDIAQLFFGIVKHRNKNSKNLQPSKD